MSRGLPLSVVEKHAIRSMIMDGIDTKKISKNLKRTEITIKKHVEAELQHLVQGEIEDYSKITKKTEEELFRKLIAKEGGNLHEVDAKAVIKKIKEKLKEPTDNIEALFKYCVTHIGPQGMMSRRSAGGKTGVAIMTLGSSVALDDVRENSTVSRTARGAIYQHKDGTVL